MTCSHKVWPELLLWFWFYDTQLKTALSQGMYVCVFSIVDLTAVCMIEGFNNPNWMMQADRVLKEIGKEKAEEYYKVHCVNITVK